MYYNLYPDHKPVTRVQERTVPVLPYLTNTPSPPDSTYPKLNTGLSFPISSSSHALHLKTQDFHLSSCSSQRRRKVLDMSFDLNLITLLPPNPIHQVLLILLNSFFINLLLSSSRATTLVWVTIIACLITIKSNQLNPLLLL